MKISVLVTVFCFMMAAAGFAQQTPYRTAVGLFIDAGNGASLVGPGIKHFYRAHDAVSGSLLFANRYSVLGIEYSHNKPFQDVESLFWNVGVGAQVGFGNGYSHLYLRPLAGIEFKFPGAPLAAGLDWRPSWRLTDGSYFEPGRFGVTFKYVLR